MKKRVLSLALAVLMLFSLLPVSAMADGETSGACTYYNVTYTLKNGVLTVSGKGACDSIWKGDFDKASVT